MREADARSTHDRRGAYLNLKGTRGNGYLVISLRRTPRDRCPDPRVIYRKQVAARIKVLNAAQMTRHRQQLCRAVFSTIRLATRRNGRIRD
ncbi:hypothetical protein HED52_04580 [Ochrobactrum ciceri]|uniref:Transposase n=1 Tax=Brucella ciceri TaxID=391287 RepID=A0ABX1DT89_9HYPH|nr:hypothetical protein [Brucella ciceri]